MSDTPAEAHHLARNLASLRHTRALTQGTLAQMLGASRLQIFRRILLPLMLPGILTAGLLVLVNTISNFELAFLLAGGGSQTLVVALYYNVFAGGVRPVYSIDAMAVIYLCTVLSVLLVALRFVRPTQMVFRLDGKRN